MRVMIRLLGLRRHWADGQVRAGAAAAAAGLLALLAASSHPAPLAGGRAAVGEGIAPTGQPALAWQSRATDALQLSPSSTVEVAVVDTGADVVSPAFAGSQLLTYDVRTRSADVTDRNGHGTFVASLAASGAARLLIVKAAGADGHMSARSEAAGIRYAVAHGARIVNLSIAGPTTAAAERDAIAYAVSRGALVVAAAGNDFARGNPVEYPAALLQPVGSDGRPGAGLVVGASTRDGTRAPFSGTGSWLSLAAPGDTVFGAIARLAPVSSYPRMPVIGAAGAVGFASGTSFAAPQVSAAAALVWGADPSLTARQVAGILEATASGHGTWTPTLGYGVIDVAAAVELASGA